MKPATKGRPGCGLCFRADVFRRPRHGKKSFRHKCPHGEWCPRGDKLQGAHTNMSRCVACSARGRADVEGIFDMIERCGLPLRPLTPRERLLVAAELAAAVYEKRTIAVAENRAEISEVHHGYRVPWSEIRSRWLAPGAPEESPVDQRVEWQPIFEAAMKRRGLLGVLKGTVKSEEWYSARLHAPSEDDVVDVVHDAVMVEPGRAADVLADLAADIPDGTSVPVEVRIKTPEDWNP